MNNVIRKLIADKNREELLKLPTTELVDAILYQDGVLDENIESGLETRQEYIELIVLILLLINDNRLDDVKLKIKSFCLKEGVYLKVKHLFKGEK